jgi:hypothetical protein
VLQTNVQSLGHFHTADVASSSQNSEGLGSPADKPSGWFHGIDEDYHCELLSAVPNVVDRRYSQHIPIAML